MASPDTIHKCLLDINSSHFLWCEARFVGLLTLPEHSMLQTPQEQWIKDCWVRSASEELEFPVFPKKKHLCAKWHIDLFLYTVFLSQHLELLFKLIIQQVLLHNQLIWNGRYNIVKNNEKSGKNDMQSNQARWFRGFRFAFTPQQGLDLL